MLRRLLPKEAGNSFEGPKVALWMLGAAVTVKAIMGFNAIVMGRAVATAADKIPLDTYSSEAASAVLTLFALWGFGQLILAGQALLVMLRYRNLVPLTYLVLMIEHAGRRLLFLVHPIAPPPHGFATSSFIINLALFALLVTGFIFSMTRRRGDQASYRSVSGDDDQ